MKWIKTLLTLLIFILVIFFSLQNRDEVVLRFGLYPVQDEVWELIPLPLFLIILGSVFVGVLIGGIGDLYQRFKLKKALRQNEKMIQKLSGEIEALRSSSGDQPSFLRKDL